MICRLVLLKFFSRYVRVVILNSFQLVSLLFSEEQYFELFIKEAVLLLRRLMDQNLK